MSGISEDDVEQAMLQWLAGLGWSTAHGPDISPPDAKTPGTERASYREVVLAQPPARGHRAAEPAASRPAPATTRCAACSTPTCRAWSTPTASCTAGWWTGVPVEYQKDGETRGDRVRLIDFADVAANDWLAVNQFTVQGPEAHAPARRGAVRQRPAAGRCIELKNPADENADIWEACDQLQTYKEDIPDLFQHNALLVISDGIRGAHGLAHQRPRALHGLAHHRRRGHRPAGRDATSWRRWCGACSSASCCWTTCATSSCSRTTASLVKKVAGYHQFHAVRAVVQSVLAASRPGRLAQGRRGVAHAGRGQEHRDDLLRCAR